MGFDSPVHWLIVILIIALLFGGSRVGSLMGELGKGLRSFKQNMTEPDETAKPPPRITGEITGELTGAFTGAAPPGPAPRRDTVAAEAAHPVAEPALPPDAERR